ncbi:MAG: hypothetical protein VX672_07410 [Planctomycetota bacterium]|nr:hypothetical protein [Planctomycetota bacterium]
MKKRRNRGVLGIPRLLSIGLAALSTGCAAPPPSVPSPVGVGSATIFDADPSSKRYALYRRSPDGDWFFGGGADAFADRAEIPMEMRSEDRARIGRLMADAGWLDPAHTPVAENGPRRLEVALSIDHRRCDFTVMANGRVLPPSVEELLRTLKSVADRRFSAVIDALPQGRRGD